MACTVRRKVWQQADILIQRDERSRGQQMKLNGRNEMKVTQLFLIRDSIK